MNTPIVPIAPELFDPFQKSYQYTDGAYAPEQVNTSVDAMPVKLADGQVFSQQRRASQVILPFGHYFNAVQYNIVLEHSTGFSEADFYPIANRKDLIGRFFQAFIPLYERCSQNPIVAENGQTFRRSADGRKLMFWRGLSPGIDVSPDGKIVDPKAIEWSTYNLLWTRAEATDEQWMMAVVRFGNADVGSPTVADVSESVFSGYTSGGVTPTNPLELPLFDADGCCECP